MSTVLKFPGPSAPISQPTSRGGNVSTNRRGGFVICWRSLLDAEWARNTVKLAAFLRLIGRAAYEECVVSYKGREWTLMRGQLVISATELGRLLCDERSRPLEKKAVERLLGWFEREGMIEIHGTPWGSIISVNNYDDYQAALQPVLSNCESLAKNEFDGETNGAPIGVQSGVVTDPLNAASDKAIDRNHVPPSAPLSGVLIVATTEQQVKETKERKDLKISCPVSGETEHQQKEQPSAEALAVLDHLNATCERRYQPKRGSLQNINGRLADGHSVDDLKLVISFKHEHWSSDLRMAEYLRPQTLFAPQKFDGYLAGARRWVQAGRPRCINGEWEGYERDGKRPSAIAEAQQRAQAYLAEGGVGYDDDTIL